MGLGRRRRDADDSAAPAVANIEAQFFSSEKELDVDAESLKEDAESDLKKTEDIIARATNPDIPDPIPFVEPSEFSEPGMISLKL